MTEDQKECTDILIGLMYELGVSKVRIMVAMAYHLHEEDSLVGNIQRKGGYYDRSDFYVKTKRFGR